MIRRHWFALSIVLTALASSVAHAEPSASDRDTARSLMEDGESKRSEGRLADALKSFEAADAIMNVPSTGIEVAQTLIALGLLVEARERVLRIQRLPVKPNERAPMVAARKLADELAQELPRRIPTLRIELRGGSESVAADLTLDDSPLATASAAAPRRVNPGAHVVVVKAGSIVRREQVQLREGESRVVTFDLGEPSEKQTASEGDRSAPSTEASTDAIAKGLIFGGFGLAALGLGVGATTGILSGTKVADLRQACGGTTCPPSFASQADDARQLGTLSTIGFLVGGAGIATGVVGLLWPSSNAPQSTRLTPSSKFGTIHPTFSPRGLALTGSF